MPIVEPEGIVDTSHQSDAEAASETERRQLRETESKIVKTGFSHLRKDWSKENLDHPAVLERSSIFRVIFRRTRIVIFANAQNITRAPRRRNPESRESKIPQAATFGDTITADHKVLNEENESRLHHRYAGCCTGFGYSKDTEPPCRNKTAQGTMKSVHRFLPQESKPDFSHWKLEFEKACEDLSWNHNKSSHVDPKHEESSKERSEE